jgi:alkaline phosphatase D
VFDRIRESDPLFYMNTGDFHYLNIATNLRSRFRAGYDAVLASPQQSELYRQVPLVYMWDDHDFGGNGSSRESRSHEAARLTYQEYVPHYPLAAGIGDVPIYQSFSVGRTKFILTDLRSERDSVTNKDDAAKSMMGPAQKAWFKQELLSARGKFPLICWVSSVPWLGEKGSNYYRGVGTNQFGYIHHTLLTNRASSASTNAGGGRGGRGRGAAPPPDEDHWSVFATERREIADFIKSNHISGVCILHGDSHMLAADDGSNGDFATGGGAPIPVMCAAPLDQDPSLKGGPYSQGVYRVRKGEGCFGLLTVTDRGETIDVAYSGRNHRNEEKIRLQFTVPAPATEKQP